VISSGRRRGARRDGLSVLRRDDKLGGRNAGIEQTTILRGKEEKVPSVKSRRRGESENRHGTNRRNALKAQIQARAQKRADAEDKNPSPMCGWWKKSRLALKSAASGERGRRKIIG